MNNDQLVGKIIEHFTPDKINEIEIATRRHVEHDLVGALDQQQRIWLCRCWIAMGKRFYCIDCRLRQAAELLKQRVHQMRHDELFRIK